MVYPFLDDSCKSVRQGICRLRYLPLSLCSRRVEANVAMAVECINACIRYLGDEQEGQKCLNKLIKHFTKEKTVAEKTLERLQMLQKQAQAH